MTNPNRLKELLQLYAAGQSTHTQELELADLLEAGGSNNDDGIAIRNAADPVLLSEWEAAMPDTLATVQESIALADRIWAADHEHEADKIYHRVHFLKLAWVRYAAAIVLLLGSGIYFFFLQQASGDKNTPTTSTANTVIVPGRDHAILTLADGRQITLDSAADGELAVEQGVRILNDEGTVSYDGSTSTSAAVTYNTMSTPRGGQYQLTLSDGTRIWLNAASSVTFPTRFTGSIRDIKLTGEVYLEVAKSKIPFAVNFNNTRVEVLGTAFNINAYPEEPAARTTLVEGKIQLRQKNKVLLLKPAQQAVSGEQQLTLNPAPNLTQVLAWKNGAFDFNDQDFATSMRQLERWYDIRVVYDGPVPAENFSGNIDKSLTMQQVLKGLNGVVARFRLEGRVLHVLPQ